MTPLEIITLRAPEIAAANSSRIPGLIDLASQSVGGVFGVCRNEAIALKVLCMISGDSASSAVVKRNGATKIKEAGLELGFSGAGGSASEGAEATWCAEFKALARSVGAGLPVNRMI